MAAATMPPPLMRLLLSFLGLVMNIPATETLCSACAMGAFSVSASLIRPMTLYTIRFFYPVGSQAGNMSCSSHLAGDCKFCLFLYTLKAQGRMLTPTEVCSEPHNMVQRRDADQDEADDLVHEEDAGRFRGRNTHLTVKHFAAYRLHLRSDAPCGNRLFKCDKLFQVTCECSLLFGV